VRRSQNRESTVGSGGSEILVEEWIGQAQQTLRLNKVRRVKFGRLTAKAEDDLDQETRSKKDQDARRIRVI
jgi:hypothetical protein